MRHVVLGLAVLLPILCLSFGIYGSYLWTFPTILIWHVGIRRGPLRELGLRRSRLGVSIVVGILSGIILGTACGHVMQLMEVGGVSPDEPVYNGRSFASSTGFQLAVQSESTGDLVVYFLYYIVLVGLGEELFWRGIVQWELKEKVSKHVAILATGCAFGLIHLFLLAVLPVWKTMILVVLICVGGIIWGYLFDFLRNIWGLAISHGITSAIIWKYYFFT